MRRLPEQRLALAVPRPARRSGAPDLSTLDQREPAPLKIRVGQLGLFSFLPGAYVYTGSARRHVAARVTRHLSKNKRLHWHIDYLLLSPGVVVSGIRTFDARECQINRATPGAIPVLRFGASDCRAGCGSHLKYLGGSDTDSNADSSCPVAMRSI